MGFILVTKFISAHRMEKQIYQERFFAKLLKKRKDFLPKKKFFFMIHWFSFPRPTFPIPWYFARSTNCPFHTESCKREVLYVTGSRSRLSFAFELLRSNRDECHYIGVKECCIKPGSNWSMSWVDGNTKLPIDSLMLS